uniref:Uncharacterized protein n=1 Tax=Setaria italica TaxID=4555 RepID=K4A4J1_SETIT
MQGTTEETASQTYQSLAWHMHNLESPEEADAC